MKVILLLLVLICFSLMLLGHLIFDKDNIKEFPDSYYAMNYFGASRAYPGRSLPETGYYSAYKKSRERIDKTSEKLSSDIWYSIGPGNVAGRTLSVALHPENPNIVFAGSASGGLWKLTINTAEDYTWELIDTDYPVLGVGAIAINPRDPEEIYIGTGEVYSHHNAEGGRFIRTTRGSYGIGILKSEDGGGTWSKSLDWTYDQRRGIQDIRINPMNTSIIYAATTEGLYKSEDSGQTWLNINPVVMAVDIDIDPNRPDTVYVSHGNFESDGLGIYRTFDGGESWTKLSGGLPASWTGKTMLAVFESSPNIVYADISDCFTENGVIGIYKSTDCGDTWQKISEHNSAGNQGWYSHFLRVNPVDNNKMVYGGVGITYSINEYEDYLLYDSQSNFIWLDQHAYTNHPDDPECFYVANDGGVHRTFDGGYSYQSFIKNYVTAQFYPGFSSSRTDSIFAMGGTQDHYIYAYEGDPENWRSLGHSDGTYTAINQEDNNTVYGSSKKLAMYRSRQKGINWEPASVFDKPAVAFAAPYILVTSKILYAGTNKVYKSTDEGDNWTATNGGNTLNGNVILSLAALEGNPDVVYAATAPMQGDRIMDYREMDYGNSRPGVFRTTDGGNTWSDITGTLPDRYYGKLAVSPDNPDVVYLPVSGFGTSHLYRSLNGGITWSDIDGGQLPDVPAHAVAVDPLNTDHIYFANDLGVWVSVDYGENWSEFKEGMPGAAIVLDLSISESNRKLRAVTHGNGVYERSLIYNGIPTGIDDNNPGKIPRDFLLEQNYPNPFNPETNIRFNIPVATDVKLIIYNLRGQLIRKLISGQYPAGDHTIKWNGTNDQGQKVGSGVYIYRLLAGTHSQTRKMLLIK